VKRKNKEKRKMGKDYKCLENILVI